MMDKMSDLEASREVAKVWGMKDEFSHLCAPADYFHHAALEFLKDEQGSVKNPETLEESHSSGQKRYNSFFYCCVFSDRNQNNRLAEEPLREEKRQKRDLQFKYTHR
jgi:hypothetical protein